MNFWRKKINPLTRLPPVVVRRLSLSLWPQWPAPAGPRPEGSLPGSRLAAMGLSLNQAETEPLGEGKTAVHPWAAPQGPLRLNSVETRVYNSISKFNPRCLGFLLMFKLFWTQRRQFFSLRAQRGIGFIFCFF